MHSRGLKTVKLSLEAIYTKSRGVATRQGALLVLHCLVEAFSEYSRVHHMPAFIIRDHEHLLVQIYKYFYILLRLHILCALYLKSDLCIPRNETARRRSQFLHYCI